jgi:hypothetical protein
MDHDPENSLAALKSQHPALKKHCEFTLFHASAEDIREQLPAHHLDSASAALLPQARNMLHNGLVGPVAKRIATEFGVTDAGLRVELVASHLVGLAFARYQLKIEPLATAGIEQLVAWMGPTIERYVTDPQPIA